MVILDRSELRSSEGLHDRSRPRSLNRQQGIIIGTIGHGHVVSRRLFANPREILFDITGVDTEEVILRRPHVDEEIIHHSSVIVAHRRIEHAARIELTHIIRHQVIQKRARLWPTDLQLTHVAHIEHSRRTAHHFVFL